MIILVHDSLGSEITNKVNEMNLVIANHISDKVIDDVIENLSRTYKVKDLRKYFYIFTKILLLEGPCWRCWVSEEKTFSNP